MGRLTRCWTGGWTHHLIARSCVPTVGPEGDLGVYTYDLDFQRVFYSGNHCEHCLVAQGITHTHTDGRGSHSHEAGVPTGGNGTNERARTDRVLLVAERGPGVHLRSSCPCFPGCV